LLPGILFNGISLLEYINWIYTALQHCKNGKVDVGLLKHGDHIWLSLAAKIQTSAHGNERIETLLKKCKYITFL
jgi:hypothetical protein